MLIGKVLLLLFSTLIAISGAWAHVCGSPKSRKEEIKLEEVSIREFVSGRRENLVLGGKYSLSLQAFRHIVFGEYSSDGRLKGGMHTRAGLKALLERNPGTKSLEELTVTEFSSRDAKWFALHFNQWEVPRVILSPNLFHERALFSTAGGVIRSEGNFNSKSLFPTNDHAEVVRLLDEALEGGQHGKEVAKGKQRTIQRFLATRVGKQKLLLNLVFAVNAKDEILTVYPSWQHPASSVWHLHRSYSSGISERLPIEIPPAAVGSTENSLQRAMQRISFQWLQGEHHGKRKWVELEEAFRILWVEDLSSSTTHFIDHYYLFFARSQPLDSTSAVLGYRVLLMTTTQLLMSHPRFDPKQFVYHLIYSPIREAISLVSDDVLGYALKSSANSLEAVRKYYTFIQARSQAFFFAIKI